MNHNIIECRVTAALDAGYGVDGDRAAVYKNSDEIKN